MNEGGLSKNEAYDIARKEFYDLRHEEEVERRVAKEEALWVGATFGKGALEVGMELEDKTYEEWKVWAEEEVQAAARARDTAYTGIGTANPDDGGADLGVGLDATEEEITT
jgi:small subunit ribosomal protein S23